MSDGQVFEGCVGTTFESGGFSRNYRKVLRSVPEAKDNAVEGKYRAELVRAGPGNKGRGGDERLP